MLIGYLCMALALKRDNRAVTALEYGLIVALIAVAILAAVSSTSSKMVVVFNKVSTEL